MGLYGVLQGFLVGVRVYLGHPEVQQPGQKLSYGYDHHFLGYLQLQTEFVGYLLHLLEQTSRWLTLG